MLSLFLFHSMGAFTCFRCGSCHVLLLRCRIPHSVWFASFAAPCATVQGDPANVAFFPTCGVISLYTPTDCDCFCYAALAARPSSNDLQRPVMPTITCPYPPSCFSSSLTLTQSFFSSYSSRHLFPSPLPPETLTFQSSKGKGKKKKIDKFPSKQAAD